MIRKYIAIVPSLKNQKESRSFVVLKKQYLTDNIAFYGYAFRFII